MADYTYHRVAGYVFTIVVHISNIVYMHYGLEKVKHYYAELKTFATLQPRYFTCWNFGLQIIYSFVALYCEYLVWRNSSDKKYKLNKHLKTLRDVIFAGILWPSTMLVFTGFWSLYLIDRDLIFPKFADKALTPMSNHIIHTLIVPIVIWEVAFRQRDIPKSHIRNLGHWIFHLLLYLAVLAYTYNERGIWIYPILTNLYGTVYFVLILLVILIISVSAYFLQWKVTRYFWGQRNSLKNS